MRINNISFSGIYDIRFPQETNDKYIHKVYNKTQAYVNQQHMSDIVTVQEKDKFDTKKTNQKLADKGIRIATTIDNPFFLTSLFENINNNLSQQYINKSKIELVLDMPA